MRTAKIPDKLPARRKAPKRRNPETDLQDKLISYLLGHGWLAVRHNGAALKKGTFYIWSYIVTSCFGKLLKGHSDLVAYKNGQAIFIEVKNPGEDPTPDQLKFKRVVEYYGMDYHVARDVDDLVKVLSEYRKGI